MDKLVREYCESCSVCQLRASIRTRDRVPIIPTSRGDELPFNHLVMDCIGPIIPVGDSAAVRPKYDYALVVMIFSLDGRWHIYYVH